MTTTGRSLRLRCPTWDHVENFYRNKLKPGGMLPARVPWSPAPGITLVLALELPNDLVIAIDCEVRECGPAPDGKKSSVTLQLHGLSAEMMARLEAMVAEGRQGKRRSTESGLRALEAPRVQARTPSTELPVPIPTDAPVDELIEPPRARSASEVEPAHRQVFLGLERQLKHLREASAHDALEVKWDADVDQIRGAYFKLTKPFHPDLFARYRSAPIAEMAQDVFIYVNKAYDRMRDAVVAAGKAIAPGPALIRHTGWMAGFEDIGSTTELRRAQRAAGKPPPVPTAGVEADGDRAGAGVTVRFAKQTPPADPARPVPVSRPGAQPAAAPPRPARPNPEPRPAPPAPPPPVTPPRTATLSMDSLFGDLEADRSDDSAMMDLAEVGVGAGAVSELGTTARERMRERDWSGARDALVEALRLDPRNRPLRALYHVAYGCQLAADSKLVDARTQFELALAHDPASTEARDAMKNIGDAARRTGLFRRLFK